MVRQGASCGWLTAVKLKTCRRSVCTEVPFRVSEGTLITVKKVQSRAVKMFSDCPHISGISIESQSNELHCEKSSQSDLELMVSKWFWFAVIKHFQTRSTTIIYTISKQNLVNHKASRCTSQKRIFNILCKVIIVLLVKFWIALLQASLQHCGSCIVWTKAQTYTYCF